MSTQEQPTATETSAPAAAPAAGLAPATAPAAKVTAREINETIRYTCWAVFAAAEGPERANGEARCGSQPGSEVLAILPTPRIGREGARCDREHPGVPISGNARERVGHRRAGIAMPKVCRHLQTARREPLDESG